MMGKLLLSIVCPAYQEEEVLPIFHAELCETLREREAEYDLEILYVDDGSRDRTLPVLKSMALSDGRIRFLSLSRNFGHQAALTAGLEHARGDIIISMDSDLQHPPAVIPKLLAKWREGYEIVLTVREDDPRLGWVKRTTSRLFYRVMSWFSDTDIRIAASDFRLLSRKALDAMLRMKETYRFLRGIVRWIGFPTAELPFAPDERHAGKSKYTFRKMLTLAADGFYSFTTLPLKLPNVLGALVLAAGAVWGLVLLVQALRGTLEASLLTVYLVLANHLIGGGLLLALGVLGEYVGRIHEQSKGRPLYLVKDCSQEYVDSNRWADKVHQSDAA